MLVVWIGNFNSEGNPAFVGVSAAAPLFFAIGDALFARLRDLSEPPRPLPANIARVPVCAVSGQIPSKFCPQRRTLGSSLDARRSRSVRFTDRC